MKLLCSEICGCQVGFKRSYDEATKKKLTESLVMGARDKAVDGDEKMRLPQAGDLSSNLTIKMGNCDNGMMILFIAGI